MMNAAPFCPWCGKQRVPGPGPTAAELGSAVAVAADKVDFDQRVLEARARAVASRKAAPERTFSSGYSDLCIGFDPQIGFALIGVHEPDGEPARLRAYDMYNKRIAWEALSGEDLEDVDDEKLAVRGHTVYVSIGRTLRALDIFTGRQKWGAEFTDELRYESGAGQYRGIKLSDPTPPGQPGMVIAVTIDNIMVALDRDTGRLLWKREGVPSVVVTALEQSGLLLFEYDRLQEVINPAQQAPVLRIEKPIEHTCVVGRYGIWQVRNWGWRDRAGIVLFDYLANQELMFEAIDKIEDDVPFVMGFNRVFCATDSGYKVCYAPNGVPTVFREGHRLKQLAIVGPTLFALMAKQEGTQVRRVLGLDPQNLAVRFDLGELSTEPNDNEDKQILVLPDMAVIVNSRDRDDDHCELWGVSPTGQILWRTYVGEWSAHWYQGGHIVCYAGGFKILRPNDGQIVMEYS